MNHTPFIFPSGITSLVLKKCTGLPYLVTAHGSDVPEHNPDRFTTLHRVLFRLWNRVVDEANYIVCPSRHLEGLLLNRRSSARTQRIPYGFPASRFEPNRHKEMRLLVVTRLFKRKGFQLILQALDRANVKPELHVVGDGPYFEASESGICSIAWTFRLPVVATSVGCFPEAIEHGHNGLLVPPREPDALTDAIVHLLQNSGVRRTLGHNGYARVMQTGSGWKSAAQRLVAFYRRLLESHPPPEEVS